MKALPAIFSTPTALKMSALGEVFSSHSTATFSISASGRRVECIAGGALDFIFYRPFRYCVGDTPVSCLKNLENAKGSLYPTE